MSIIRRPRSACSAILLLCSRAQTLAIFAKSKFQNPVGLHIKNCYIIVIQNQEILDFAFRILGGGSRVVPSGNSVTVVQRPLSLDILLWHRFSYPRGKKLCKGFLSPVGRRQQGKSTRSCATDNATSPKTAPATRIPVQKHSISPNIAPATQLQLQQILPLLVSNNQKSIPFNKELPRKLTLQLHQIFESATKRNNPESLQFLLRLHQPRKVTLQLHQITKYNACQKK